MVALLVAGAGAAVLTSARAEADPRPPVASTGRPGPVAIVHGAVPVVNPGAVPALNPEASVATAPAPASVPAGPPDMASLLAIADEVSSDGRYVRIGDVAISASPVVTRSR
jgi:hypothetical protein